MAYQIVAEREDLIVRMNQHSLLFTLAKARIFASEGWSIVVTDPPGRCCTQRSMKRLLLLTPFQLRRRMRRRARDLVSVRTATRNFDLLLAIAHPPVALSSMPRLNRFRYDTRTGEHKVSP